jgi:hypothetical protein
MRKDVIDRINDRFNQGGPRQPEPIPAHPENEVNDEPAEAHFRVVPTVVS